MDTDEHGSILSHDSPLVKGTDVLFSSHKLKVWSEEE
jgi:hypothetical protein